MRIALIYPPPWKIAAEGEPPASASEGPPAGFSAGDLDGDFYQLPYGLLTLAAVLRQAGHSVKLLNLSAFTWITVARVIAELDAALFGLSCWTANRRGVALVAQCIRDKHPRAHIVVGGPHASPLAAEMLAHHPAIDTVVVGEGEHTLLELVERLGAAGGPDPLGAADEAPLAGAVSRRGGRIETGPARPAIAQLDRLPAPQALYDSHILMTARGCPWACTFCGAESAWGRGYRAHSVPYVLDALERVLSRLPVKMILIKDDTFTTNRKRVLALCRGIRERRLRFLWSCDTRVDLLDAELLRELRLAGCQRLSLGVETGAPEILARIDKKISIDDIITSTELAKQHGLRVRYFMMLGNRGETKQTFAETLDFLERARPHEYIFSCLSIYPGTRDFRDAEAAGWLSREEYFADTFQELKSPFDATEALTAEMDAWFRQHAGLQVMHRPDAAELQAVLERLGEHHAAHVDLAVAHFHAGDFEPAKRHLERAVELGYPLPGLIHNARAAIAAARGDGATAQRELQCALELDSQHATLLRNVGRTRRWLARGGRGSLDLEVSSDFVLLERTRQPTLPGPLPAGWQQWAELPAPGGLAPVGASRPLVSVDALRRRKLRR